MANGPTITVKDGIEIPAIDSNPKVIPFDVKAKTVNFFGDANDDKVFVYKWDEVGLQEGSIIKVYKSVNKEELLNKATVGKHRTSVNIPIKGGLDQYEMVYVSITKPNKGESELKALNVVPTPLPPKAENRLYLGFAE